MPNIKSQKDRVVQAKKEAMHNKAIKTSLKTVIKKADAAIDSNAADKDAMIRAAVAAIDSAKSKGVIHKNTAARKISRMAKRNNKVSAAQQAACIGPIPAKETFPTKGPGFRLGIFVIGGPPCAGPRK